MTDRPDFLCVGAQKAATSWLYLSLSRLPGVFMPIVKDSHYFRESSSTPTPWARELRLKQVATLREQAEQGHHRAVSHRAAPAQIEHFSAERVDDDWYRGVFAFAHPHELAGEVCPSYFGIPEHDIERAWAMNPEMAVLLFVRDPVDRCWSHIKMHRQQQQGRVDIDRAFTEPGGLDMYLDYTIYDRAIPRWRARFGDRLRLFVFDDVAQDPGRVFGEALSHIGYRGDLARGRAHAMVAKNVGDPEPLPVGCRAALYERLGTQYDFLASLFPRQVAAWRAGHEQAMVGAAPRSVMS